MPSFEEIMAMAQNAQAELQKAQDNLDNVEVEGAAGRRAGQGPRHAPRAGSSRSRSTTA